MTDTTTKLKAAIRALTVDKKDENGLAVPNSRAEQALDAVCAMMEALVRRGAITRVEAMKWNTYMERMADDVAALRKAATAYFNHDMTADVTEQEHLGDLARSCRNCTDCVFSRPCESCMQGSICDEMCSCDDMPDSMPW